jgi:hypothetical protein
MNQDITIQTPLKSETVKQLLSFLVMTTSMESSSNDVLTSVDFRFLSDRQIAFVSNNQNSIFAILQDNVGKDRIIKLFDVQNSDQEKKVLIHAKAISHIIGNLKDHNSYLIKYPRMNITIDNYRSSLKYYVFKTLKNDEYFRILNHDGSINAHYLNNQLAEIYGHELDPAEIKNVLITQLNVEGQKFVLQWNGKYFCNKKLSEMLLLK